MTQSTPTDAEANIFAEVFILTGLKTSAFKAAFPKSQAGARSANSAAVNVYKHSNVLHRIQELQKAAVESVPEEFTVSISDRKKILARVTQMGLDKKQPALGAVVSAVSEMNKMDGNQAIQGQKEPKSLNITINTIDSRVHRD